MKKRGTLVPPTVVHVAERELEYSIHKPSTVFREELRTVFPALDVANVLVIPTFQRTSVELIDFTPEAELEKDACLATFRKCSLAFEFDALALPQFSCLSLIQQQLALLSATLHVLRWFAGLQQSIKAQGHWTDFADPVSGMPALSPRGSSPYCESSAAEHLLPYQLVHIGDSGGGCSVISHPTWSLAIYPATLFSTAPLPGNSATAEGHQAATAAERSEFPGAASPTYQFHGLNELDPLEFFFDSDRRHWETVLRKVFDAYLHGTDASDPEAVWAKATARFIETYGPSRLPK
eukprot:gene9463-1702_t